jgi:hypothetical protein
MSGVVGLHHVQLAAPAGSEGALRDGLAARLAAAGAEVTWDGELPGFRRCYVTDPVGNRLELLERV